MRVRYSIQAELDLDNITDFGVERWGEDQAARYAAGLIGHIAQLAAHPERDAIVQDLSSIVRSAKHVNHRIFYSVGEEDVVVLRILHASQYMARHLP